MNDENDKDTEAEEAAAEVAEEAQAEAEAEDEVEVAEEEVEPEEPEDPLAAAQAEAAHWKDRCLRTAADFDNFRKRSRKEIPDAYRRGREEMFVDLLVVFDNLERAVAHAESATEVKALADGIRMVLRLFADTLSRMSIERIEAVGQPFDPALHEAIQHMPTGEYPPGAVAAEVQPGYKMGDKLVRPSMVVVAKAMAPEPDPAVEEEAEPEESSGAEAAPAEGEIAGDESDDAKDSEADE